MKLAVREDRDHPTRIVRRVARNTIFLGITDVANKLMMFVFYLIAARHLGVQQFGVLSFALAFVTMLAVFTDLGIGAVTAREIARDRTVAQRYVRNAVSIKAIASLLVIGLIVVSVRFLGYPASTVRVVGICSLFVIESAFTLYLGFVFQGFEHMEFTAFSRILQTLVLIAGAVILSRGPASAERYALLYAGAGLVSAAFAWLAVSIGFVKPGFSFDIGEWKRMLRQALPVGMAAAFAMFYYWNGSTLLSKLSGDAAVGIYSAPFRLVMGLGLVGWSFSGALYPVMSRLFTTDPIRLTRLTELALKYMLMLVLPIGVLGMVLARPAIPLVFGSSYLPSVPVFRVLVWWIAAACLNSLLGNYFLSVDRARVVTIQTGVALPVSILANLILIPAMGALGAALAIVVAETGSLVYLAVRQLQTENRVHVAPLFVSVAKTGLALVPATVAAVLVARTSFVGSAATALSVYVLMLLLVRGLGGEDLRTLRVLLGRSSAR